MRYAAQVFADGLVDDRPALKAYVEHLSGGTVLDLTVRHEVMAEELRPFFPDQPHEAWFVEAEIV